MMKLYNVPRGSYIRVVEEPTVPPFGTTAKVGDMLLFKYIDGMYSYCISEDGYLIHLDASTEVERC
jgi:hypothetical protein